MNLGLNHLTLGCFQGTQVEIFYLAGQGTMTLKLSRDLDSSFIIESIAANSK